MRKNRNKVKIGGKCKKFGSRKVHDLFSIALTFAFTWFISCLFHPVLNLNLNLNLSFMSFPAFVL